jgi:hypothetical protein
MKSKKLITSMLVLVLILGGLASVSFAATSWNPAEIVAGLTGRTTEEVEAARDAGTSYGAQAKEAGELEAFQEDRLAAYEARLNELVDEGRLTKEEASDRLAAMTTRIGQCTGDGTGAGAGQRQGFMNGNGGVGRGMGRGVLNGTGRGGGLGQGRMANCPVA